MKGIVELLVTGDNHYTKEERKRLKKWAITSNPRIYNGRDCLATKVKIKSLIEEYKEGGMVNVHVDETDCDHCRATSTHKIPASVVAYEKFCDDRYEYAEGRVYINIMSPAEAAKFTSTFRDYIAEAHEVQLVNYLVATDKPIGLLINFGKEKVQVKRKYKDPKNSLVEK